MSDLRRRSVRLSVFLLPALVAISAAYFFRPDLRDAATDLPPPGFNLGPHSFIVASRQRAEELREWVDLIVAMLEGPQKAFGFRKAWPGFYVEVRREPGASEWIPGTNRIILRGVTSGSPSEFTRPELSRLIARAMLRSGAPADADLSPWFEEGVSTYFECTTKPPLGSRKEHLIHTARLNAPATLAAALSIKPGPYFAAVSHSLVAFLKGAYSDSLIAEYATVEREPGPVPPGTFERIFGVGSAAAWRESLEGP